MLTAIVFSGFALAVVAPLLTRMLRGFGGWACAMVPGLLTVALLTTAPAVIAGQVVTEHRPWAPLLGVALSFRLDGLALLFALMISGIGALVFVYAGAYMQGDAERGRLLAYLSLFKASMLGLVLADNILTLFVFWELTSITSYLLIGFEHHRAAARSAALQALLVTGVGGLALLAGLLMLGHAGGSYELSDLLTRGADVQAHPWLGAIVLCVLAGAFTKSAQVPFHFWLSSAMQAPTPVSAYLHSSTMVKAGVYLVARLAPVLGDAVLWSTLVTGAGTVTMLTGAVLAWRQTDLKRILAYSTVSSLGTLMLLIGTNTPASLTAAAAFVLAHALYKGALFLTAGAVKHQSGEGDIGALAGLRTAMPLTATAAGLAAASMAGFPPLFGFIAKELLLETSSPASGVAILTTVAIVITSLLTVVVAARAGVQPFWGRKQDGRDVREAPIGLWAGALVLSGLGVAFGLAPLQVGPLVGAAASAMAGETLTVTLSLWHGLTPALGLSAAVLAGGVALYRRPGMSGPLTARTVPAWSTPSRWYDVVLAGANRLAVVQTRILQSGYLRFYVASTIVATGLVTAWALVRPGWPAIALDSDAQAAEIVLALLVLTAAIFAVRARSTLGAVVMLGAVGYGIALLFAIHGAPDLAMTQFVIEALVVVLFVLVVHRLPMLRVESSPAIRLRNVSVALAAGLLMTGLVLAASNVPVPERISTYFGERSVSEAHGRNVVNVILVDFRALDTLGEILVLALAGIGVHALIRLKPAARRDP